jgi:hypothetical protein
MLRIGGDGGLSILVNMVTANVVGLALVSGGKFNIAKNLIFWKVDEKLADVNNTFAKNWGEGNEVRFPQTYIRVSGNPFHAMNETTTQLAKVLVNKGFCYLSSIKHK